MRPAVTLSSGHGVSGLGGCQTGSVWRAPGTAQPGWQCLRENTSGKEQNTTDQCEEHSLRACEKLLPLQGQGNRSGRRAAGAGAEIPGSLWDKPCWGRDFPAVHSARADTQPAASGGLHTGESEYSLRERHVQSPHWSNLILKLHSLCEGHVLEQGKNQRKEQQRRIAMIWPQPPFATFPVSLGEGGAVGLESETVKLILEQRGEGNILLGFMFLTLQFCFSWQ